MAMGCVGMSREDFERCTPFEFTEVMQQWRENQERIDRTTWDQTRFLATAMLQPYSRKALKATDVVKFTWDDKTEEAPKGTSSRERMEEVRKRIGK